MFTSSRDKKEFILNNKNWKDNNEVTNCEGCEVKFSTLLRKHHCRQCGDIFCYRCSGLLIDNKRTCAFCFVNIKKLNSTKSNKDMSMIDDFDIEDLSERSTLPSFHYVAGLTNNNIYISNHDEIAINENKIISRINSISSDDPPITLEEYQFNSPITKNNNDKEINGKINENTSDNINKRNDKDKAESPSDLVDESLDKSNINESFIAPWPLSPIN